MCMHAWQRDRHKQRETLLAGTFSKGMQWQKLRQFKARSLKLNPDLPMGGGDACICAITVASQEVRKQEAGIGSKDATWHPAH